MAPPDEPNVHEQEVNQLGLQEVQFAFSARLEGFSSDQLIALTSIQGGSRIVVLSSCRRSDSSQERPASPQELGLLSCFRRSEAILRSCALLLPSWRPEVGAGSPSTSCVLVRGDTRECLHAAPLLQLLCTGAQARLTTCSNLYRRKHATNQPHSADQARVSPATPHRPQPRLAVDEGSSAAVADAAKPLRRGTASPPGLRSCRPRAGPPHPGAEPQQALSRAHYAVITPVWRSRPRPARAGARASEPGTGAPGRRLRMRRPRASAAARTHAGSPLPERRPAAENRMPGRRSRQRPAAALPDEPGDHCRRSPRTPFGPTPW